ncbi:MAG: hypothetical protein IJD40_06900 [Lachnospiraceae bacterium]|nr:hypothetical protein [Lachnospiraceae bacterium]
MLNAAIVGITLLIIMGLSLLFYVVVKVTPEESFASAIMTILVLIYIAGLAGNTQIAVWIVYALSIAGTVVSVVKWGKKDACSFKTFWSPGIIMVCGLVVFAVVVFKGMHVYNWDELYQWGKAANYMVEYDKLPSGDAFAGQSVLLSSTTFFHYFIADLSAEITGVITESNYYVSNLLLWFAALILPFSGADWKQWKRVFAFGVFHFLLTSIIFVQPYYNIYTDQATSYWAGGMIAWLVAGKCHKKNVYLIPLVLINVGLMKSMVGPLFAVIVVLSIIVLYIASCNEEGKPVIPGGWNKVLFSKKGLFGMLAVLSPFILMGVWSVATKENGIFRFNGGVVQPGEENRAALTLKSMIGWIFESVTLKEDSLYLSYGVFFILTVAVVYILYPLVLDTKERHRYQSLMRIYLVGFALYFVIMYIAYMMVFGYVDSIKAMSLNRYFSDYMMLGVVPLTVPLFKWTNKENNMYINAIKKALVVVFTLCILYGSSDYLLQNMVHVYAMDIPNYAAREKMIGYCEEIKELTDETGKIYFINQRKSGLFTLVADYEMDEQVTRDGMCFKFRKDTSEPILGLTEYPIETFPQILRDQGYSYVWVYSNDNYFKNNMKELFGLKKIENGNFYKVVVYEDRVELQYLDRIK